MEKIIENCHYVAMNEGGCPRFILKPKSVNELGVKNAIQREYDVNLDSLEIEWVGDYCYNATAKGDDIDEIFNIQPVGAY